MVEIHTRYRILTTAATPQTEGAMDQPIPYHQSTCLQEIKFPTKVSAWLPKSTWMTPNLLNQAQNAHLILFNSLMTPLLILVLAGRRPQWCQEIRCDCTIDYINHLLRLIHTQYWLPVVVLSETCKNANAVHNYFRGKLFDGNTSQSIHGSTRTFEICAKQFRLSMQQKTDFYINIFDGHLRKHLFDYRWKDVSSEQLADVMFSDFDSDARRFSAQSENATLCFERFMSDHGIQADATRLSRIVKKIVHLTLQSLPNSRSDTNRNRYLRQVDLF